MSLAESILSTISTLSKTHIEPLFHQYLPKFYKFVHLQPPNPRYYVLNTTPHFHADEFFPLRSFVSQNAKFLLVLSAIYLTLVAFLYLTARRISLHSIIFCLIFTFAYLGHYLNALFGENYLKLGLQRNYFDANGVFFSSVFEVPLILICMGIAMEILWVTGQRMMRKVFRKKKED